MQEKRIAIYCDIFTVNSIYCDIYFPDIFSKIQLISQYSSLGLCIVSFMQMLTSMSGFDTKMD